MGVFAITCASSLWAYIWLFLCVRDMAVTPLEAWLTLSFFALLIGFAFAADKYNGYKNGDEEEEEETQQLIEYSTMEIYKELINEKQGLSKNDKESIAKRDKMKKFLKETMHTDEIERINIEELKAQIEGKSMLSRL